VSGSTCAAFVRNITRKARRLFDPRLAPLALFLTGAAPAHADPPVPGTLSNEHTITRWATALDAAPVRERPAPSAPRVAKLRYFTEDRLPEVYVALRQAYGADGAVWVEVRVPMRPNGTTGWVPRTALNEFQTSRGALHINRGKRTATLIRHGKRIWRSRIGVGKPGTPTPKGIFYIRERINALRGGGPYGPIAFGTSAYSRLSDWPGGGVIGIHGTNQPGLLPGAVSHGCVRVPNTAIKRLARLLTIGTPVHIR
jgi:lipoprotein-anchoring transpeptidase ErfK/SrfK